ncbi:hypothetical protein C7C56_013430 [Massilia glaciei]|uniref:Uncharacterized protein n=2 Tax=Massilia glaciei TaxID=1524097 RepID=A0A2U2HK05_9BURK|nr:hypothetical protein C7C56_013430 [Massilia glaciei]
MAWMRLNRILAWALLISPVVQLLMGTNFWRALPFDFALLLGHGALSLVLFGVPKMKGKGLSTPMLGFGIRDIGMSARNDFLLSGYRIAMVVVAGMLVWAHPLLWMTIPTAFYSILRLPVSIIEHLYNAIVYAFKRWGVGGRTSDFAELIVTAYFLLSIANLVVNYK